MHLLSVVLDAFYVAALPSGDGPRVVHRDKRVLDACPLARERGVVVGMPLAEARSILVDGTFVAWEEEAFRTAQRRWLSVLAEHSDVVEPLRQHEALVDLSAHPRPRETAERIHADLQRAGYKPRSGLASSRWVARLAARRGDPLGLAHADPASYVADVPLASLPIAPEHARSLDLLGYRIAQDLRILSVDTLRTQVGAAAHGIAQAALGKGDAQVKPLFPEDAIAARYTFERPPTTRQELDAGFGWIAQGLGAALRDRDAVGRTVEMFMEDEEGRTEKRVRTFASSLADEGDLSNALRLMLPRPPARPPATVRVRLPELRASRRVQLDIQGGRSRKDMDESVQVALQHVRGTYGEGAVRRVSEIPEPRWVRVRRAYRELNGWVWA